MQVKSSLSFPFDLGDCFMFSYWLLKCWLCPNFHRFCNSYGSDSDWVPHCQTRSLGRDTSINCNRSRVHRHAEIPAPGRSTKQNTGPHMHSGDTVSFWAEVTCILQRSVENSEGGFAVSSRLNLWWVAQLRPFTGICRKRNIPFFKRISGPWWLCFMFVITPNCLRSAWLWL